MVIAAVGAAIEGLAPGRYRVRVTKGAATATSDVVEVFEGGVTPLEMRLLDGDPR